MSTLTPNRVYSAHLVTGSPRYEQWRKIFGECAAIPLVSPVECRANLGDKEKNVRIYELDLTKLTAAQFSQLVMEVARKFDATPIEVELDLRGDMKFPIRSEDVFIAWDARAFL